MDNTAENDHKKKFAGRYDRLAEISEFIAQVAKNAGFDEDAVYALQLAVDEACTNIIEHAYGGEDKGEIQCVCDDDEDELIITLHDWGKPFNPDDVPDPDFSVPIEEIESRGAGLMLIKKIMDDVKYKFSPKNGNLLIMVKHKTKAGD